jgi:hypothetical protein
VWCESREPAGKRAAEELRGEQREKKRNKRKEEKVEPGPGVSPLASPGMWRPVIEYWGAPIVLAGL